MNTLPTLSVPKYSLVIPSTQENVEYRPYLVREEKVLMIASESEDVNQIQGSLIDIVSECLNYNGDIKNLTNYDLEYIFLQLRAKSVGESIEIIKECPKCEHKTDVTIDITKAKLVNTKDNKDNTIKLEDNLSLELTHATVGNTVKYEETDSDTEILIKSVATALVTIYYGEETYDANEASFEERISFVESLSTTQFQKAVDFLLDAPYVLYKDTFTCSKCGYTEEFSYTGLIDFFI